MAPPKGKSNNPAGLSAAAIRHYAKLQRQLSNLTPKAIAAYQYALENGTPSERIAAANAVLDRLYGRPRQQVEIEGKIEHAATAHVTALVALAQKAGPILDLNTKPNDLISNDNPAKGDKLPINHAQPMPIAPPEPEPGRPSDTADRPDPAGEAAEHPPTPTPTQGAGIMSASGFSRDQK